MSCDFDIFNGDADGLCALHQLRLAEPRPEAELVTGVKRDLKLLARLTSRAAAGDRLTVLDISLDANRKALDELLGRGCQVFYADHHFAGELPASPGLTAHIDPDPEVCTALIVDRLLKGRFRPWAVAAAFGDNLHETAIRAAREVGIEGEELAVLRELGELINYNGYGATVADLHFPPQELYLALKPYADPWEFAHRSPALAVLRQGFAADLALARDCPPCRQGEGGRVYLFPAAPWSRRVAGVFSNEKARERPELAHALLVDNGEGTFMASVRAPIADRRGADALCRQFPTGGGRAGAAGINALPAALREQFINQFLATFSR